MLLYNNIMEGAMDKLNVAVIFGGVSSEYEISCLSAANVVSILDPEKYNVYLLGITKDGKWMLTDADCEAIRKNKWQSANCKSAFISPDRSVHGICVPDGEDIYIDVAFPIMHGKNGEDGAIAALLKLAGVPQTTTTMTSGANSMDKVLTKLICDKAGIAQADWEFFYSAELEKSCDRAVSVIESRFDYPVFVKPASAGSSVGVSKCSDREELVKGLLLAAKEDFKVLVEETIVGFEVEAAVLGNSELFCPTCGQIAPSEEFYSYDSKYNDENSKTFIPALVSEKAQAEVIENAKKVFAAMECQGFSRIDFFVTEDERVIFNELNTIPGFTDISMYPKLMAYGGLEGTALADRLITLALAEDRI